MRQPFASNPLQNHKKISMHFSILALCLFAGLSYIKHAEPPRETPATQADLTAVTEWQLSQLGDQTCASDARVTLVFGKEGMLSGSGGVKRFEESMN